VRSYKKKKQGNNKIFVGIDVHRDNWHVTLLTEGVEIFSGSIPGKWDALRRLVERYRDCWSSRSCLEAVYEAGYFGFGLYDNLTQWGASCIVTPPSKILREQGNRVKTDRLDSRRLAYLLSKGLLKEVWVPSKEARCHRQVIRRRRQLINDRVRTQNRIKAELHFHGIGLPENDSKWSKKFVDNLRRIKFGNRWLQESFTRLMDEYDFLTKQIIMQTRLLKQLSETEPYRKNMKILKRIHRFGLITSMEILLEIGDFSRFLTGDQLASYVGLTPSQHSSGDKVRLGRITKIGKNSVRAILIQASWRLIAKDEKMMAKFNEIKARAGAKRAIVAVARNLLLRCRRMILDGQPHVDALVA
jgi:transposase